MLRENLSIHTPILILIALLCAGFAVVYLAAEAGESPKPIEPVQARQ